MTTAILAVQGAFAEHARRLEELGERTVLLRQAADLAQPFERLVLPGGESTVQGKLLREQDMLAPLRRRVEAGMPVLATCAGLILLACEVEGEQNVEWTSRRFRTLDVRVRRNAYGRQLGSFHARADFAGLGEVPLTFIRAPRIERVGDGVEPLAWVDGHAVAVRAGKQLACAFHPELDSDPRIHQLFLDL